MFNASEISQEKAFGCCPLPRQAPAGYILFQAQNRNPGRRGWQIHAYDRFPAIYGFAKRAPTDETVDHADFSLMLAVGAKTAR
jgi:hypothetical protein